MATKKATASRKKSPAKKKVVAKATTRKTVSAAAIDAEKEQKWQLPKPSALMAEFIGVFALTGAFFALFFTGTIGIIGISLVLIALVVIFAVVSGAHFNPAVTIALWANRKIGGLKALLYILVQCFGALVAFFVFRGIFAITSGVDFFAGSEGLIMSALADKGVTEEVVNQAGGLLEFAKANNFNSVAHLAEYLGIASFAEIDIKSIFAIDGFKSVGIFVTELIGAIIFGFGAGFAYIKKTKPVIKALALGFALFAGLAISGSTVILNPAIAGALGSFGQWWSADGVVIAYIMWPIITYIIATVAGILIGLTAYRYLLKGSGCDCDSEDCNC
jgi:glycerol uptake facilitator-like aquaporin